MINVSHRHRAGIVLGAGASLLLCVEVFCSPVLTLPVVPSAPRSQDGFPPVHRSICAMYLAKARVPTSGFTSRAIRLPCSSSEAHACPDSAITPLTLLEAQARPAHMLLLLTYSGFALESLVHCLQSPALGNIPPRMWMTPSDGLEFQLHKKEVS